VEFFIEKHGLETLQRVLTDLTVGMPINEALARYAGSLEALDSEFTAYVRKRAEALAPQADWSKPELPRRARSELIAAWLKDHPHNYAGLARLAEQLISEQKFEEALGPIAKMRMLYPADGGDTSPYRLEAEVHRALKDAAAERAALEQLAALVADDVEALSRLIELCTAAEDWEAVRRYALRWIAVNPLQPAAQRAAAAAAEHFGDGSLAIDSYRALLLLDPFDPAEIHLKLAGLYEQGADLPAARRHALLALEETPRFRAAHQRLLAIVEKLSAAEAAREPKASSTEASTPAAAPPAAAPPAAPAADSRSPSASEEPAAPPRAASPP
jgi:hypothetical protein